MSDSHSQVHNNERLISRVLANRRADGASRPGGAGWRAGGPAVRIRS